MWLLSITKGYPDYKSPWVDFDTPRFFETRDEAIAAVEEEFLKWALGNYDSEGDDEFDWNDETKQDTPKYREYLENLKKKGRVSGSGCYIDNFPFDARVYECKLPSSSQESSQEPPKKRQRTADYSFNIYWLCE